MQARFKHCDEFRFRVLHAVPRGAQPADGVGKIGAMIEVRQPTFKIAVLEMALDLGWLQCFEMAGKFSWIVGLDGKPALVAL